MSGVLVDTAMWSLALRKKVHSDDETALILKLSQIIRDLHVVMIGPVRQEILSGLSDHHKYEDLRQKLNVFKDQTITTKEYELAAQFHNECRRNGIQGSHTDYLICAVAQRYHFRIFTLDNDFRRYQQYIEIELEPLAA